MQSIAVLYCCMVAMPLGQAVSDTDVYLIKAEEAAFVIHKPKPPIISNENLRPKNYEEGIPLTAFGGVEHRGGIQTAERPRGRIPFRADGLRPLHRSHPRRHLRQPDHDLSGKQKVELSYTG